MNGKNKMNLKEVLICDIECYSSYDINDENEKYLQDAKTKYIGFYSYANNKYHTLKVKGNEEKIRKYISMHKVIVTFNGDKFDLPILKNNNNKFIKDYIRSIDLSLFLFGDDATFKVGKAQLMGLDFPKKSLKVVAETLNFPVEKSEIDYMLFAKDDFTKEEDEEIKKYLINDIEITKRLFDKIYNFWLPFASFISEENSKKWRFLTASIASIGYMYACNILNKEEKYGKSGSKTDIGGRVIEPRVEEAEDVVYADCVSLYPNIYGMFDLFNETDNKNHWHGNEVFKVKGYYDISYENILSKDMMLKLKERIRLKIEDKKNPLIYAYKILLNSMYGANRSSLFENLYTENSGSDCAYLGQQINKIMEDKLTEKGYYVISGDTDSIFFKNLLKKSKEEIKKDLDEITDYIKKYVPYQQETFYIDIEKMIDKIWYISSQDETKKLKKNYVYISNNELTIMGLPIIKSNATKLGKIIFNKYLKEEIIKTKNIKFDELYIKSLIKQELKENILLIAQNYRVNKYSMYSEKTDCIQKKISDKYFERKNGSIQLIKNSKVGKVKSSEWYYCNIEESKNLNITDLDLTKVMNELKPFIKQKEKDNLFTQWQ